MILDTFPVKKCAMATADDCTWKKYIIISVVVDKMRVREKRSLFNIMRTQNVDADTLFPAYGLTAGEFATYQVLGDNVRRRTIGERATATEGR